MIKNWDTETQTKAVRRMAKAPIIKRLLTVLMDSHLSDDTVFHSNSLPWVSYPLKLSGRLLHDLQAQLGHEEIFYQSVLINNRAEETLAFHLLRHDHTDALKGKGIEIAPSRSKGLENDRKRNIPVRFKDRMDLRDGLFPVCCIVQLKPGDRA